MPRALMAGGVLRDVSCSDRLLEFTIKTKKATDMIVEANLLATMNKLHFYQL